LPVEGIDLELIQAPKPGLESCGMISRTLNGLRSGREQSAQHFPVLATGASLIGLRRALFVFAPQPA
jgi:hypothetical protein